MKVVRTVDNSEKSVTFISKRLEQKMSKASQKKVWIPPGKPLLLEEQMTKYFLPLGMESKKAGGTKDYLDLW